MEEVKVCAVEHMRRKAIEGKMTAEQSANLVFLQVQHVWQCYDTAVPRVSLCFVR